MNEETLTLIEQEFKRPKSRRRKKVKKLVTTELITKIESEIGRINLYLTKKIIEYRGNRLYQPNTGDEDQPQRQRVEYLLTLVDKLKKGL